jgi:hypothetical protein
MAHENEHERIWRSIWGSSGYISAEDADKDGLNDQWEIANPDFTPNHPFNNPEDPNDPRNDWNTFVKKSEEYAKNVENSYPDKSQEKDWAYLGKNW